MFCESFFIGLNRLIDILELLLILFSINSCYDRSINGFFLLNMIRCPLIFVLISTPESVWGGPIDCIGGPYYLFSSQGS